MAKAHIHLSNGTSVALEGTPEEICALLKHYDVPTEQNLALKSRSQTNSYLTKTRKTSAGSKTQIRELVSEGFFNKKRALKEIQDKLAEHGHIYPANQLSPRLIELTKEKELRRFKENKVWVYVNK